MCVSSACNTTSTFALVRLCVAEADSLPRLATNQAIEVWACLVLTSLQCGEGGRENEVEGGWGGERVK